MVDEQFYMHFKVQIKQHQSVIHEMRNEPVYQALSFLDTGS